MLDSGGEEPDACRAIDVKGKTLFSNLHSVVSYLQPAFEIVHCCLMTPPPVAVMKQQQRQQQQRQQQRRQWWRRLIMLTPLSPPLMIFRRASSPHCSARVLDSAAVVVGRPPDMMTTTFRMPERVRPHGLGRIYSERYEPAADEEEHKRANSAWRALCWKYGSPSQHLLIQYLLSMLFMLELILIAVGCCWREMVEIISQRMVGRGLAHLSSGRNIQLRSVVTDPIGRKQCLSVGRIAGSGGGSGGDGGGGGRR